MSHIPTPREERRAACAAVNAMAVAPAEGDAYARRHGLRPLKPPPTCAPAAPTRTAGAAELAREIRRGTFDPSGPRFGS